MSFFVCVSFPSSHIETQMQRGKHGYSNGSLDVPDAEFQILSSQFLVSNLSSHISLICCFTAVFCSLLTTLSPLLSPALCFFTAYLFTHLRAQAINHYSNQHNGVCTVATVTLSGHRFEKVTESERDALAKIQSSHLLNNIQRDEIE